MLTLCPCYSEVMNIRRSSMLRTRSQSVDSDQGSLCSSSSSRSPVNNEAESLIRDLNLACRNISKTVVVANIEVGDLFSLLSGTQKSGICDFMILHLCFQKLKFNNLLPDPWVLRSRSAHDRAITGGGLSSDYQEKEQTV